MINALKKPKTEPNNLSTKPKPMPFISVVRSIVKSAVINNTDKNANTKAIDILSVSPVISAGMNGSKYDAYAPAIMNAMTQPAMDSVSRTNPLRILKAMDTRKIPQTI